MSDAPQLLARLTLPDGIRELRLGRGDAALLTGEGAAAAVGALTGADRHGSHRVVVAGRRLDRRSTAARVRRGLGLVVDAPVAADVSVLDHLGVRTSRRHAAAVLATSPLLAGRGADRAGVLSGGERRVLAWLRCIVALPLVVVLDSAGTGLDDEALSWATDQVWRLRTGGAAVVVRAGRPEEFAWAAPQPRALPDVGDGRQAALDGPPLQP